MKLKRILSAVVGTTLALSTLAPIGAGASAESVAAMSRQEVVESLERANDYFISTHKSYGNSFWDRAAYHTGNMEAYMLTGIEAYRNYSEAWAEANQWAGNRNNGDKSKWVFKYTGDVNSTGALFGDWQTCFQTFIDLYQFDAVKQERKVARAKEVMGYQITTDENGYWWWADGLYMVMPVMAKMHLLTGNQGYLDKLYEYFKFAKELMYDGEGGIAGRNASEWENLFYRDGSFVNSMSEGKKNFWARGMGWVFASLAKVLQDTPDNWEHRDYFLKTYLETAQAIKNCQVVDSEGNGFWTQSMLAHTTSVSADNPLGYETSGTAFFTYGLLWGINSGTLNREEYADTALRGVSYLLNVAMREDGLVGYVQPIGGEATKAADRNYTTDYGVGATLLALSEMARYVGGMEGDFYPYLQKRMVGTVALQLESPYAYVDNQIQQIDAEDASVRALTQNDRTLVPVRAISQWFGATVDWMEAMQTITVKSADGAIDVTMQVGNPTYTVNGVQKTMETAPQLIGARTYLPLRAMAEALGKMVYWNDAQQMIVIGYKEQMFYACEDAMVTMLGNMLRSGALPNRPEQVERSFSYKSAEMKDPTLIQPVSVSATAEPEAENPKGNATDGDLGTRWAASGENSITYDLGAVTYVSKIGAAFWKSDTRTTTFKLEVSADATTWTQLYSGESLKNKTFSIVNVESEARYVRLTGYGNSDNSPWTSLLEMTVHGAGTTMQANL